MPVSHTYICVCVYIYMYHTYISYIYIYEIQTWSSLCQEMPSHLTVPGHQYDVISCYLVALSTLRPRQNGRRFAEDTFKRVFLNENIRISITISLKFVPKVLINNIPALVQIMAWRRPGDKPLSEPMMVNLLTHICVTRPQWVKGLILICSSSLLKSASVMLVNMLDNLIISAV